MPIYDFRCQEGHRFERVVKLENFEVVQACACGLPAQRLVSAPRVVSDVMEPCLGPDGKMHDSLTSFRASCEPGGNPQGEKYNMLGDAEMPEFKAPEFDRKERRDAIKQGIQDVKDGKVPNVVTGDL